MCCTLFFAPFGFYGVFEEERVDDIVAEWGVFLSGRVDTFDGTAPEPTPITCLACLDCVKNEILDTGDFLFLCHDVLGDDNFLAAPSRASHFACLAVGGLGGISNR